MTDASHPAQVPPFRPYGAPAPAYGPPRPPGRLATLLTTFRSDTREQRLSGAVLGTCLVVGVVAAIALVGHQPGLGAALVGSLVWVAAAPTLWRRGSASDLVTAALSVALLSVVAVLS